MNFLKLKKALLLVLTYLPSLVFAVQPSGGVLNGGQKPRIIVSTDIGGNDADDFQSMVHLLVYADVFDIEGLVSSPPYAGRKTDILSVIDAYEDDYSNLSSYSSDYPSPNSLRNITKQGATGVQSGSTPPSNISEGAQHIINRAKANDNRPLYILVWGSITDVAQAVHKDPSIKNKIRVYSIGSWNTWQDPKSRDYLYNNHADMWWIENNSTFRGMYSGGTQSGDYGNTSFISSHVRYHGSLGNFLYSKKDDIKMGDTPSVLYLLTGNPNDPTSDSWGGRFRTDSHGPYYWKDRDEESLKEGNYKGAKTVNQWRVNYLDDWEIRMDRAKDPNNGTKYTLSISSSNGAVAKSPNKSEYDPGETVILTANANSGYEFNNWSGDASGSNNPITITMNGNKSITANFQEIQQNYYTLIINNGTGDGDYTAGSTVNISADPAPEGFVFTGWNVVSGCISQWENIMPACDVTIEPIYTEISDQVNISNITDGAYQVSTLQIGNEYYVDRSYTITSVPSSIEGLQMIMTQNNDKNQSSNPAWSFDVDAATTIYVAYDSRVATTPDWMSNYSNTGMQISTEDVALNVFSLGVSQGTIQMGGNKATGHGDPGSMYIVIVSGGEGSPDTYTLSVNGTIQGNYEEGEVLNISCNCPQGKVFDNWAGDVSSVADPNSCNTTVTMPAGDIDLNQVCIDEQVQTYTLYVIRGTGDGNYEADASVNPVADQAPEGYVFSGWTVVSGCISEWNGIMPACDVTIEATYSEIGNEISLAVWDCAGTNGSASNTADNNDGSIVTPVLTPGPGLIAKNYGAVDGFEVGYQQETTLAGAIANDDYLSFTITPNTAISVTKVQLRPFSQNRSRTFTLLSSVSGFNTSNAIAAVNYSGNSGSEILLEIPVNNHNGISNAVEYRIYIHGGTSQYESCGLAGDGNDLVVTGSVGGQKSGKVQQKPNSIAQSTAAFTIFPNPANQYIFIHSDQANDISVSVYNCLGTKVLQKNIPGNRAYLDISHLQKGMYLVSVNNQIHRIIKN